MERSFWTPELLIWKCRRLASHCKEINVAETGKEKEISLENYHDSITEGIKAFLREQWAMKKGYKQ